MTKFVAENKPANKNKGNKKHKVQKQTQNQSAIQTESIGKAWSELNANLHTDLLATLVKNNFLTMLPIQEVAIPLMLKNYDLAVEAQTGSGKTLVFLVPLLQRYLNYPDIGKEYKNNHIKFLILAPTRQLIEQIYTVFKKLLMAIPNGQPYLNLAHCVNGGNSIDNDILKVKNKLLVLFGTVGRIRDLAEHMEPNWLKKVDFLFVDEADRVLKEKGIQNLVRSIQKVRRTSLFSATMQGLTAGDYQFYGMRNLAKVSLKRTTNQQGQKSQKEGQKTMRESQTIGKAESMYVIPKSLTNTYLVFESREDKIYFLLAFLQGHRAEKIIVFFNTCCSVDFYTKLFGAYLAEEGYSNILGIHGKLKNKRRIHIMEEFTNMKSGCLMATDVVSRGIDFDQIHYILQIDPPEDPDNYVHRIGRTARINKPGTAVLFIEPHEQNFINYLAGKSVGVMCSNPSSFVSKQQQMDTEQVCANIKKIMLSDRDYIQKSKKAFVSFIRSYKQHQLRYIFQFKHMSIGRVANSFFLLRLPRIKEILGRTIEHFQSSQIDIQSIPWKDKNQQMQFRAKMARLEEAKRQQPKRKQTQVNKNDKSKRKKIKAKNQLQQIQAINREHRLILKERKKYRNQIQSEDEDTEEIQRKINQKYQ